MNTINVVVTDQQTNQQKLRPWAYVAKDIIAALGSVESTASTNLGDAVSELNASISAVASDLSEVESRVTANETAISTLQSALNDDGGLASRIAAAEGDITQLQTDLDALETQHGSDVSAINSDISAIQSAISAIQTTYASTDTYGLTKVTDVYANVTEIQAGMSASPKAVQDAFAAAVSYADAKLAEGIAGAYKYKGSVTDVSALPASGTEGLQVGDIYNVQGTTPGQDDGANYAWTGSSWDNLGGIFKVEAAITEGNGGNADSKNPPSTEAVVDFVNTKLSVVNADISSVSDAVASLEQAHASDVTALNSAINAVATDLSTLAGRVTTAEGDIDTLEGKVSTLEGKVSTIEGQIDNDSTETPGILQRLDGHDDDISDIDSRLDALESGAPTATTSTSPASGSTTTIDKTSATAQIIHTTGTFTLAFTKAGADEYAVKEVLLHADQDTVLTVSGQNVVFADAEENPVWGKAGYELYLRATFINGEVILQVLSNSQEAYNAAQYVSNYGA